jgi:hypothetical protein
MDKALLTLVTLHPSHPSSYVSQNTFNPSNKQNQLTIQRSLPNHRWCIRHLRCTSRFRKPDSHQAAHERTEYQSRHAHCNRRDAAASCIHGPRDPRRLGRVHGGHQCRVCCLHRDGGSLCPSQLVQQVEADGYTCCPRRGCLNSSLSLGKIHVFV